MDQQRPSDVQPADASQPPAPAPAAPPASSGPPPWQGSAALAGPAPGVEFAGYGARIVAYLVDSFLLGIVITALTLMLTPFLVGSTSGDRVSGAGIAVSILWAGVIIGVGLAYFPYFWQRSGQTPGMRMFGIRVVRDKDGGPVDWGGAILRYVGYAINSIVFGLPIGWLWVLFDSRRRGWHDLIGGTVVVKA